VDANILIFARMKEEIKAGKGLAEAINEGFARAWPSIRDSNFNSLIVCAILFLYQLRLLRICIYAGAGILISLFSAIFITRIFLMVFIGKWAEKSNGFFNQLPCKHLTLQDTQNCTTPFPAS